MNDNLTLFTYTNSKASDLHDCYFDRIKKFFNPANQVALCDTNIYKDGVVLSKYNNKSEYHEQIIEALKKVKTDYIIYSQEDYVLFDYVDLDKLKKYINVLETDKRISFVRLIHSGIDFIPAQYNDDLIYLESDHQYYFSTQASVWRKEDFKQLFESSRTQAIWDECKNSSYLKNLKKIGLCVKEKGKKIGNHFNSRVYPYIATAIVKGKWNYSEYPNELESIYEEYGIKKEIRGIR